MKLPQETGPLKRAALLFGLVPMLWPLTSYGQLAGLNTRGDYGIQSGTQPPPGHYAVGMLYDYSADTLRDKDGDSLPATTEGGSVDASAAVFGYLWVSEMKLFGGNYGFAAYPAVTNNAGEFPALQTDTMGAASTSMGSVSNRWEI